MTSTEGKKAKIDVIGTILSAGKAGESPPSLISGGMQVHVRDNTQAREVVTAFLDKWNRSNSRGKVSSPTASSDNAEGAILGAL